MKICFPGYFKILKSNLIFMTYQLYISLIDSIKEKIKVSELKSRINTYSGHPAKLEILSLCLIVTRDIDIRHILVRGDLCEYQ